MTTVLVVDDSAVDRRRAGQLLENGTGWTAVYAENGREALALMQHGLPDLVLTDLQMPELDGLALVQEIKAKHPLVPVILMTAFGSEDIAIQALQQGAASYVPKRKLAQDLAETVQDVLEVSKAGRSQQRLQECLTHTESHFVLDNDPALIPSLIGHLEANLARLRLCDENGLIRVAVALREALINAMHHGNLEVASDLREQDDQAYYQLIEQRRQQPPYKDRRVHIIAQESRFKAVYIIRDEGPGFDSTRLRDPTDPSNLEKVSGRGLLLIRTFMDEVHHNEEGNQITMVKRGDR